MRRLVLLAVAAVLAAAAPAAAQWSAPQTVSSAHTFIGPLRVLEGPIAVFGWQDGTAFPAGQGASATARGGERPVPPGFIAAGRYGAQRVVALSMQEHGRGVQSLAVSFGTVHSGFSAPWTLATGRMLGLPSLSVTPNGRALVAWVEAVSGSARTHVKVAYRPIGGRFGRARTLIGTGRSTAVVAAAGTGADLGIVAVRENRVVARLRPRGGRWRPLQTLARPDRQTRWEPRVAIDDTGHVQAAWRRYQKSPARRTIEAASAIRGRRFGSVQTLAEGHVAEPRLLHTGEGFTAGYILSTDRFASAQPRIHVRRAGRRFGGAIQIAGVRRGLRALALASSGSTLAAAWIVGGGVEAAVRPFGAGFAPAELVASSRQVSALDLAAAGGDGGYVAAWAGRPGATNDGPRPAAAVQTVVEWATRR